MLDHGPGAIDQHRLIAPCNLWTPSAQYRRELHAEEMPMKTRAAVAWEANKPLTIETIEIS
ncbi:MAG TPA: hypothetical protein PKW21_06070, partial [Rhabdaerophilum sp.]|nr:hypothetical protein [Rhabdaerophilum sp.]